jgi:RNA polymerase sigma-70 factor (ECF subfamily)
VIVVEVVSTNVEELLQAGRRHWPLVKVDRDAFTAHLAGFSEKRPLHPDLYLAFACIHLDPAAIIAFESLLAQLPKAISELRLNDTQAQDAISIVRDRVLHPPAGVGGKISDYRGDGPLPAWLRVAAVRLALNMRRSHQRAAQRLTGLTEAQPPDIERDLIKLQLQPVLSQSVATTLAGLSVRDRRLLRMYFVDELTLDAIGSIYKVNRSTVHRWINRVTRNIAQSVREQMGEAAAVATSQWGSLLGVLRSQLTVSLRGLRSNDH